MKRIIYKLIFCLSVLSFASCVSDDIEQEVMVDNDAITLQLYTGANGSRAAVVDEAHEYAMSHLDVFIFNSDESKFHYERIATTDAPDGTVTLSGKTKSEFTQGTSYWVYVVANSSKTVAEMEAVLNLGGLKALTQTDVNIHLSGLDLDNVPKFFLMDGIAYKGESEPTTAAAITINDGTSVGTTVLKVNLRRAAAKVEVVLKAGDKVEFFKNDYVGYYLRNMPTVTSLLAESPYTNLKKDLVDTRKTLSAYSKGKYKGLTYNDEVYNGKGELTIITYVYAHDWNEATNSWETQTNLVVNIPVLYQTDISGTPQEVRYDQSYYQIELGKDHKFERNHYYLITGTINAPGAEEFTEPIELQDMKYSAMDWTDVTVNVGGETKPTYLKVNKDILRIYNQPTDESLVFASSSPITITVYGEVAESNGTLTGNGNPYYYNKYAVKTDVDNTIKSQMNAASLEEGAMSGNIIVNSPIPTNKTIRYYTLLVENKDGNQAKVLVEQYPVIYVTNQLGWYSYRSDFGSSYVNRGDRYVSISLSGNYNWRGDWQSWNGGYELSQNAGSGFWYSKVEVNQNESGNNMNIEAYEWPNNYNGNTADVESANPSGDNARIYHITVTATSSDYTVGRPRMTAPDNNGLSYTDPSDDNAKLVSPSFMIASRLGVVTSSGGNLNRVSDNERLIIFRNHCANYVEVVKGKNGAADIVYDDWRLPTEAELRIIMDYQGTSGQDADAIDYLLNGKYYFGAAGPVENDKATSTGTTVRCVRDAY